jgi:DNA (cytosine-5)-methyltransferase 1
MIQKEYVHASFCTGIGACELAAMWMGWRNAFSCEIDPFCHQVLKYYYPHIKHYENIFGTDFSEWRGKIDILTAGFPCQPFSCAGSRKGAEDDRYLWPEVLRGVDEIRPNWFIGENVAGITSMVLPGDEIKVGSYTDLEGESYLETEMRQQFIVDRICNDLESIGYSVQPIIIPACAVGAPHRRDRIWFIANCSNARPEGMQQGENGIYEFEVTANTDKELLEARDAQRPQRRENQGFTIESFNCSSCWENFPSQSPVRFRYDGISNNVVRYIKTEVYDAIKEYIRREDLPRVWEAFQKKKVREQIGGLFEIPEPNLLLEVLQRTSENRRYEQEQNGLSQFSEETSGRVLCYLRKYGTFASSPFGQKYKEQFAQQFGNIMPELSYEIALATKKIVEECERTASWVRAESIKAYGNSMVPQLVYQIFKAIGEVENLLKLNQNKKT